MKRRLKPDHEHFKIINICYVLNREYCPRIKLPFYNIGNFVLYDGMCSSHMYVVAMQALKYWGCMTPRHLIY